MIKIANIYDDLLNLYGDTGNAKALAYHLRETGEEVIFKTLTEAARSVNMGLSTISERLQSGTPTKSGYRFEYVD